MNVSLTPQLEELVNQKVASGEYTSVTEVIQEALRLLDERDHVSEERIEELRKEIAIGIDQADRGLTKPFDDKLVEEIKSRGRVQLAEQQ